MKKIIWLELLLLGASILVFRSVWMLLDATAWASTLTGQLVLLGVGLLATVFALCQIESLAAKRRGDRDDK